MDYATAAELLEAYERWLSLETPTGFAEEALIGSVLAPLFQRDGYVLNYGEAMDSMSSGFDMLADDGNQLLAVEIAYAANAGGLAHDKIAQLVGHLQRTGVPRAVLVTNSPTSSPVRTFARGAFPVEIDLLDPERVRAWIGRAFTDDAQRDIAIESIVRQLSRALILRLVRDPDVLAKIEWRDLERVVAEIFEGLGFQVELTPPAKDGGKDVVVSCRTSSGIRSYVIEVKHWRAGKKVVKGCVNDFIRVVAAESREGGVFLSTSGYAGNAFEELSELQRQTVRFGGTEKVLSLCRRYERAGAGLFRSTSMLSELLYEDTLS